MTVISDIHPTGYIPLHLPRRANMKNEKHIILAGDVGGTKTNLALYEGTRDHLRFLSGATFVSADYPSAEKVIEEFLLKEKQKPDHLCLGVAGPVIEGKVELTNLSWVINVDDLRKAAGTDSVGLINDLEATAYGLATQSPDDFINIQEGDTRGGNMAIIAPGTGLGEAGLFWDKSCYRPYPTEGGHCDFSPRTDLDIDLYKHLESIHGIVSWERLVSGPAIYDIFKFLCKRQRHSEPAWLTEKFDEEDPSAIISQSAMEKTDAVCVETMRLFVRYFAREASNLTLKMKAIGGLFLGGGIPPKIAPLLKDGYFLKHYMDTDRMQHLLRDVPIRIILNQKTALLGAACYGAYCI
jgi:glucokinase